MGQVPLGLRIPGIDAQGAQQIPSRLRVFSLLDAEKCHQILCLHKIISFIHHAAQLNRRQVRIPVLRLLQRAVIAPDIGIQLVQHILILLRPLQIVGGPVVPVLEIGTDNPVPESFRGLTHLHADKTQKIPGFRVILIQIEAGFQHADRAGQVPDLRQPQPFVIEAVGNLAYLFCSNHFPNPASVSSVPA